MSTRAAAFLVLGLLFLTSTAPAQPIEPPAARAADSPPKLVLAFYYPWYGTPDGQGGKAHGGRFIHWEGVDAAAKTIASSTNYPALGAYDSQDPAVLTRHCELAKAAGIDAFIISWWGKKTFEDEAIIPILDACEKHGLKACIYYETVAAPPSPGPSTPDTAAAEIADILTRFGRHPAYLRIKSGDAERPVVFVYGRAIQQLGPKKWARAIATLSKEAKPRPFLIADSFNKEIVQLFDGAHAYGPAGDVAAALKKGETAEAWAKRAIPWWASCGDAPKTNLPNPPKLGCVTVFPGYDDTKIRKPGLRVDRDAGAFYELLWRETIASSARWVLITSFNEWHEGSEIEPSVELGDQYVKLTAKWAGKFKEQ